MWYYYWNNHKAYDTLCGIVLTINTLSTSFVIRRFLVMLKTVAVASCYICFLAGKNALKDFINSCRPEIYWNRIYKHGSTLAKIHWFQCSLILINMLLYNWGMVLERLNSAESLRMPQYILIWTNTWRNGPWINLKFRFDKIHETILRYNILATEKQTVHGLVSSSTRCFVGYDAAIVLNFSSSLFPTPFPLVLGNKQSS